MRLIDADAIGNPYENTSLAFEFMVLKKILDDAPTIDAVEVVRCKDCKYWCNEIDEHTYECCTRAIVNRFKPTDYCSFAERKEEE